MRATRAWVCASACLLLLAWQLQAAAPTADGSGAHLRAGSGQGAQPPHVLHDQAELRAQPRALQQWYMQKEKPKRPANASSSSGSGSGWSSAARAVKSNCPAGCTLHGTCNEELGRCDCPRNRKGPACEAQLTAHDAVAACRDYGFNDLARCTSASRDDCLNLCNGRGTCYAGWCHCQVRPGACAACGKTDLPVKKCGVCRQGRGSVEFDFDCVCWCHCQAGYYGADCSLSLTTEGKPQLLAGYNYQERARGPKIYVYELPPRFNTHLESVRLDRPLFALFWQRLLSAGVRTPHPQHADYFFVPVKMRMQKDTRNLLKALDYIQQTWPYWNKTGDGKRHIIIHTGDQGRAEVLPTPGAYELRAQLMARTHACTWLTHWGLYKPYELAGWIAAHRPGQDIVVPIFMQTGLVRSYRIPSTPLHPRSRQRPQRRTELFFAGRICGNRKPPKDAWPACSTELTDKPGYSAQTRAKVYVHFSKRPGFKIVEHSATYARDMMGSKFCLAPTGSGHGKRSVLVALLGCIPVTVTDHVYQPFEPELNWSKFSVPVAEKDIPAMAERLEAYTKEQLMEMRRRLYCGAQHMFWSSIFGAIMGESGRYDAFETVMEILRARIAHPGVAPGELATKDEDFKRFMECLPPKSEEENAKVGGAVRPAAAGAGGGLTGSSGGGGKGPDLGGAGLGAGQREQEEEEEEEDAEEVEEQQQEQEQEEEEELDELPPGAAGPDSQLCTHSEGYLKGRKPHCVRNCNRGNFAAKFLLPGGSICCKAPNLADCPRLWD